VLIRYRDSLQCLGYLHSCGAVSVVCFIARQGGRSIRVGLSAPDEAVVPLWSCAVREQRAADTIRQATFLRPVSSRQEGRRLAGLTFLWMCKAGGSGGTCRSGPS